MSSRKLTILITGCSPGGTGAALATAFHKAGHHVFATARNPAKLAPLATQGMKILELDITKSSSISSAVSAVSSALPEGRGLDMLVNNAAGSYSMPIADVSLDAARELFDINVWAQIAVTQAFIPLLLKATTSSSATGDGPFHAMVVNHSSVGSVTAIPFQGIYNTSKAALSMLTSTLRLELAPFNIRVIELKTAGVTTNLISNNNFNAKADTLPKDSIYAPAREVVEKAMSQDELRVRGIPADDWARQVSALLLARNPPTVIWKGESAGVARLASLLPSSWFEGMLKKMTKMNVVERIIGESRR